ncbi:MAG: type II secretion system F family protein, partial [Planctomycetaceae bacterium]|nr:type II secretion system F family protein [Planctomycetaceae bacterium]
MINVKELAGWCRRAAIMLNAGLDILTVLEREAGKYARGETFVPPGAAGPKAPPVLDDFDEPNPHDYRERIRKRAEAWREKMAKRPRKPPVFLYSNMQKICGYALGRIRDGATLHEAFSEVGGHFPKLFVPMIAVAERSGSLGETFAELAQYYEYQLKLKREFWQMMIYPIFTLGAAVVIIFLYILIMGALGRTAFVLGISFFGVSGALKFLLCCAGIVGIVATVYYIFKYFFDTGNNIFHFVLNVLPKIGKAMRCFAMARFTWALCFTTKTGMDVNDAVALGFDVAAYAPINTHTDKVLEQLGHGVSLHEAFSKTRGFPHEFLTYLQTGEQSGELPETLAKLSDEYAEQTKVHMKILSVAFY